MCLRKMKNRKSLKNKISGAFDFTFVELCFIIIMLYVTLVLWNSQSDPHFTKNQEKPKKKQETKKQRKYLNCTRNPTIIYWSQDNLNTDVLGTIECEELCDVYWTNQKLMLPRNSEGAYLFYGSRTNFANMPLPRNPQKVIWAFQHEESPKNVLHFMHEKILNLFNYSSTFSRHSDVPYPLHYMISLKLITSTKYFVKTEAKNRALKEIAPILYIQSSCKAPTQRDEYVKELMNYQRIDSYGACLNNKPIPNHLKEINSNYLNNLYAENFLKFMARYKFVLTIENGLCDDYISEKFWRAIHVGVVPIYFGAPTIRDWLPNNKSALILDDFPSPLRLSARINTLMRDDDLYEEYLQHKTKALISNQKIIEEIKARPYQTDDMQKDKKFMCFICKKLYQKDKSIKVVPKSHYNCPKPKPIFADSDITWAQLWETSRKESEEIYDEIMYF
ncbi:alpha-(1,3)-fucosyltransferase 10-like [Hyposmocoma kahamanoa]|uniref:alpha-(1,3)-fucosyltransferase 10-like n=1 Tax=Hyposmocoma kahamanoa TaxID=1477025 RepID=UPI000E6D641A|nr:alpha-(1,3)-fucosyltransferase 10-like [Hyposmocoma kahamanoa]